MFSKSFGVNLYCLTHSADIKLKISVVPMIFDSNWRMAQSLVLIGLRGTSRPRARFSNERRGAVCRIDKDTFGNPPLNTRLNVSLLCSTSVVLIRTGESINPRLTPAQPINTAQIPPGFAIFSVPLLRNCVWHDRIFRFPIHRTLRWTFSPSVWLWV